MSRGKVDVSEVQRLSQEEGLLDKEIAEALGCHRVTVSRIRLENDIPRPNLSNRKDKEQVCKNCGQVTLIRRRERIRRYCYSCRLQKNAEQRERSRERMRRKQK